MPDPGAQPPVPDPPPHSTPPHGLPTRPSQTPPPPPPELISKLLDMEAKRIALSQAELDARIRSDALDHDWSTKALSANENDRKHERVFRGQQTTKYLLFAGAALVVILAFMGYTVYAGKDDIAKKLIETIVLLIGGVLGGWGANEYRHSKDKSDKPETKGDDK